MKRALFSALSLGLLLTGIACGPGGEDPESLVVYSGRNERLIGPLLETFEEETGVEVEVRYGETAELAAVILEEGARSPADVYISQDAAALGALADAERLRPLPPEILDRVPARFRDPEGRWVGLSGRVRTVVYNTERIAPEELPRVLEEVVEPRYEGRFGVAPMNASFQAHMAVYHAVEGREALEALLIGMVENNPRIYPKNSAIVQAVLAGEVDFGLVNHYYLWRELDENPEAPGANAILRGDEVSSFVNLAGTGVLNDRERARSLVAWLLSEEAQQFFADETFEYPLVEGVEPHQGLTPLEEIPTPQVDFGDVSEVLEDTLLLIRESGLLP